MDQTKKKFNARLQLEQVYDAKSQPKLHIMPTSTMETHTTFANQLHQQLEGEAISIGDILELDIPSKHFSNGNLRRV
jgi:hypothetical protein